MTDAVLEKAIPEVIAKGARHGHVVPNLLDYVAVRAVFSWEDAARELSRLPGGGINIVHEAVDRHAGGLRADHLAT